MQHVVRTASEVIRLTTPDTDFACPLKCRQRSSPCNGDELEESSCVTYHRNILPFGPRLFFTTTMVSTSPFIHPLSESQIFERDLDDLHCTNLNPANIVRCVSQFTCVSLCCPINFVVADFVSKASTDKATVGPSGRTAQRVLPSCCATLSSPIPIRISKQVSSFQQ